MQPVKEGRTAGTVTDLHLFDDQSRILEHGQVLANSVVIELHIRGQLGYSDGSLAVDDIAEQAVASRIAEGPGLALNVCCVHGSPR